MFTNQYKQSQYKRDYPNRDILNGAAREVIEAEFTEIATGRQRHPLAQRIRDALQWIKQRRQRL